MSRSPAPPLIALLTMAIFGPRPAWADDPDDTIYDMPWGVAWQRDDSGGIMAELAAEHFGFGTAWSTQASINGVDR